MSDKSVQKKNYIVECARKVFIEKGYKDVTMKDIVEACDISRGGLYLYFESTEEIFKEVLKRDRDAEDDAFSDSADATPLDILLLFFKEQKKELLRKKDNLSIALYEYYFANRVTGRTSPVRQEFNMAVRMLERLIIMGVEAGEFDCEDPEATARSFMLTLEGMKISMQTMGLSADMIDKEFAYLLSQIVADRD